MRVVFEGKPPARKTAKERRARLARLITLGFDKSKIVGRGEGASIMLWCSQCSAASINSTPCHEKGCPNIVREHEENEE